MNQVTAVYPDIAFLTAALRSWLVNHLLKQEDLQELEYLLLELGYADPPAQELLKDFLKREMSRLAAAGPDARLRLIRLCEGIVQFYLLDHPRETPELDQLNRFLPPGLAFSSISGRLLFEPEHYFQPMNQFVHEQEKYYLNQQAAEPNQQAADTPPAAAMPQAAVSGSTGLSPARPGSGMVNTDAGVPVPAEAAPESSGSEPGRPAELPEAAALEAPEEVSAREPAASVAAGKSNGRHGPNGNGGRAEAARGVAKERGNQFKDIRNRRLQLLKSWETSDEQA